MVGLLGAINDAMADNPLSMFTISGFGTFGMTYSNLDTADYESNAFRASGAGASHRIDTTGDTDLGLQLTARLTSRLSALVQVVAQQNYDNTFRPSIEWANLDYAFALDFNVRVGRIELPTFLASDYRKVGYALPWVRVPQEVYNVVPVTNSDGIDVSYRMHPGSATDTLRVIYGGSVFHVPGPFRVRATGAFGLFDTLEYRALTARIGYMHAHLKLPFTASIPATTYTAGFDLDMSRWFVQAELVRATASGLTPGYLAGYATLGWRAGAWTPYLTYAQTHSLGHPLVIPNGNNGQKDVSAGVRWDFAKGFDLKVQYDHVWTPGDSIGWFANLQPAFRPGGAANVATATVDFSF